MTDLSLLARHSRAYALTMTITNPSLAQTYGALEDSTLLLGDPLALRQKAQSDGYLFFAGLLPQDDVQRVRDDVYRTLVAEGTLRWLGEEASFVNRDHIDNIPREQMRLDIGVSIDAYIAIQKCMSVHELPHHPKLIALYRDLFGEDVFVHPRHIVRAMTGHPALRPTPPHQDFPLIQGTKDTWTAWFPLDDCPVERGPLSVLRGSHKKGYLPIGAAEGAGGLEALLCDTDDDWLTGGFRAGDVLTFPSYTVHRAVPASTSQRIRVSMDVRFQAASEPIEAKSLTNHSEAEWEQIYVDWPSTAMQYYWKASTPRLSPWDDSFIQPGQRIC